MTTDSFPVATHVPLHHSELCVSACGRLFMESKNLKHTWIKQGGQRGKISKLWTNSKGDWKKEVLFLKSPEITEMESKPSLWQACNGFYRRSQKMLSMCSIIDKVSDVHLTKDCTHFAQMHVFLIQLKHKPLVIAHNTSCLIYGTSQGI